MFTEMRRYFARPGAETRFQEDYLAALNQTLQIMHDAPQDSTDFTRLDATDDTIEIDDSYRYCVRGGIVYHLIEMGYKPRVAGPNQGLNVSSARRNFFGDHTYTGSLERYIGSFMRESRDDDNTYEIWGRDR
jgi:hypothetical protein